MNDQLTLADPWWLLLVLLVIPLAFIKAFATSRARAGLEKVTSTRLRSQLVSSRPPLGDWGRFAIQALGLILLAIALARPQKGFIEEMTRVEGRNIIVAIDTSRSMLAEDIVGSTSRLQQAKFAAIDLVKSLPNDRIGLMAFAGSAMMQSPLTPDHNAVIETIDQLNTYVIERGGTNLSEAIDVASKRLSTTAAARNALILFTDGDDLEGVALKAAEKAAKENVVIITVGLGSEVPVIVPDPESGKLTKFLKDKDGELVKSSMDRESLEKIANATNGKFIELNQGLMNKELVDTVLANISYSESEDQLKRTPRERFFLPLLLGLACVTAGFVATLWGSRPPARAAIAALLLLGTVAPENLTASTESNAYAAYKNGDYEQARDQYLAAADNQKKNRGGYELAFGSGSAAYQHGDYDTALEAFGTSLNSSHPQLQERSHYNLGNTLFRKGEQMWKDEENGGLKKLAEVIREWEDAAAHYRDTLSLNGDNQDAQANLDIVEDLLEQLKQIQDQQQEQQPEEPEDQEEQEDDQEQEEEEKEDAEESEEEPPSEPGEDGEENPEPGEDGEESDPDSEPGEEEGEDPEPGEGEGEQPEDGEEGGEDSSGDETQEEQEGEENEGNEASGSGDPTDEEGDQENQAPGEPVDPDDEVNEETGYSKNQAKENLEKLSDEQRNLGLLRRRQLRQNTRRYRDW